jgi:hypothetical protein
MEKIEDAVAGERVQNALPFPAIGYQANIAQDGQVLGNGGNIVADFLRQIADAGFAFGKPQDDKEARRVSERL